MAEIETKASQPGSNQRFHLGIWTIIIVAMIVTMCSGRTELEKIQEDTAALRQQIGVIDKKLDTLLPKGSATSSTSVEASAAPADAGVALSQNP